MTHSNFGKEARIEPFRIAQTDSITLTDEVRGRLSQIVHSVDTGSDDVLRSPFLKDLNDKEALSVFDKVFLDKIETLPPAFRDLELSNRDKFGPRSIAVDWSKRRASLKEYFEFESHKEVQTIPTTGGRLRRISLSNAVKVLKNQTSSGLPKLRKKAVLKQGILAELQDELEAKYPCVLYTRTQEREKTRNIWGYPFADTLNEMVISSPLTDYYKAHSPYRSSLVGPSAVDDRLQTLLNRPGKKVSIDFTAYDAHIDPQIQVAAREKAKSHFQESEHAFIDSIYDRMSTIGIVTPDGIYYGSHAVPSGSPLTNIVDSDAQYMIARNVTIPESEADIHGDDGAYNSANPDELISNFVDHGLLVNEDKTHISDDYFIYLQNYYSIESNGDVHGKYPIYRAYMRLRFLERWTNFEDAGMSGQDYFGIRAISILENVRYHPLFEELVKFVVNHDKFGLDVSEKGLVDYVNMVKESSGTQGILLNQRGDDVEGIRNFATFKLVSEMS
uniref:RdRp n=1 Tax=viral metagenome TaxID=1070528 RepID=A0A2V0RAS4_9ZZZZ